MADRVELSSSEQYVRKSNRRLLVIALIAFFAFLFGLLLLSGGSRPPEDVIKPDVIIEPIGSNREVDAGMEFGSKSSEELSLSAYPTSVSMTGVVLGSSAEAIITLTANGGPIRLEGLTLAQEQQDGFIISPTENCGIGKVIPAGSSCNIQVLWNPVSIRSYSNYLTIRWRLDDATMYPPPEQKTLRVDISGQSTDSKDCVICETKEAERAAARMGELDEKTGLYIKDGEIMGIVELDKIAISNYGAFLGKVKKDTKEVVDEDGEVLGRVLGDGTVVTKDLEVLGGALPLASVLDASGNVIGQLTKEGTVVDENNKLIGLPMADGSVVDADQEGRIIGSVMPWAVVLNLSSKAVGATQIDGTVLLANGEKMGRVLPGGLVVNDDGVIVGGTVASGLGVGNACHSLGRVAGNGKVYNAFDQQVGYTSIDGLVMDMSGVPAGRVVAEGVVLDLKGNVSAFVNSEGKAVSADANMIGCVNPDSSVSSGTDVIGAVMPRGRVMGYDLSLKGIVLPNGMAVNAFGDEIGAVKSSGYVFDMEGKLMGAVVPKGTAVAPGCVLLGVLDLNGQVLNNQSEVVGIVNPDKKVINNSGEVIGGVTPMGAVADLNGKFLGYVLPTGKVVDKTGQVIGCVNPDGTVVNEKGEIIGKVVDLGVILDANGNPTDQNGLVVDGKLVNEKGEIIGFVPPDGIIVSSTGEFLGRFTRKVGFAVDAAGNKFARVLPDYTAVSVENSDIIGALIPDGTQVIDVNNERIGSVQGDGAVLDTKLKVIGSVRADGRVFASDDNFIGATMPTGSVLDWNGNVVGSVQSSGKVVNGANEIGKVTLNRTVVNSSGQVIGMVFPEACVPLGEKGEVIGALTIKGTVNRNGKPYGHITPAGNVFANNGEQVGALVRLGSVIGNDGKIKGWVAFDGALNAKENFAPIGKMMPNGAAVNDAGQQIGHLVPHGTVANLKGNFEGIASVDGRLLSNAGEVLGSFPYDDRLLNEANGWIGRALKAGVVLNPEGKLLGYTRYDAKVVDNRGQVLGQVRYDNRVIRANNDVIGQYVPYGQSFFDQKGKVLGAMSFDGVVRDAKGEQVGALVGTTLVNKNNEVLGNAFDAGFAISEQGKTIGYISPNAKAVVEIDGNDEVYTLTTSQRLVNKAREIVGGSVPAGIALGLDLSNVGEVVGDGAVLNKNEVAGKTLTDAVLYDGLNRVIGGSIAPSVIVGRDGRVVGTTTNGKEVNDFNDKKIGLLLPFGTSLNGQNTLVGMTMPTGVAVDDFAKVVGFVASDGSVVKSDGAMSGRVMQDGTVVRLLSRDIYGVMPDFADVVASGVAIGLKPELFGRAMPSGDVLDTSNKKIASILDDATLLGTDGNLKGALVGWRTAIDHNTVVIGNSTGDGYATNVQGEKIGPFASNGAIKGKHQLKTLGAIVPKELVAKQCRVQGQVRYDGRIIDGNGNVVGSVGIDGMAKDDNGNSLGGIVQKGTVIAEGEKGEVLGRTLPDADVVNKEGISIGCALEDGTVIDKDGNVIGKVLKRGIVVDADGNVLGRVLRDGSVVDANGNVIGHVLADGRVVDADGNVIGHVVDIKKNHLLFDDDGKIFGSMDKAGRVFDNNGKHLFTVSPDDKLYDPNGNLIGSIDENGNILDLNSNIIGNATNLPHYLYDANGNIIGYIKDNKIFDNEGNQIGWIDADGNIYDMNGNLIGKINPDGSVEWFNENGVCANAKYNGEVRDANGELLYTIKCGKIYDKDGNLIGYIDENGNMYDLDGNYMGRIDENGNVYDADGNLIGKWTPSSADAICVNAKYNGDIYDNNGELLYRIKCGKIYDKDGNLIGYIDENGNMYDLNGNYMGRIDENGNVYDADGNLIGKFRPEQKGGFVHGVKDLLKGSGTGMGPGSDNWAGRKIAIGDKTFTVGLDNTIRNDQGAVIGALKNGVPYALSGNLLSDELSGMDYPNAKDGYPQEQLQFDPNQAMAMRELLARRRAEQKQGVGRNFAKITPDGRVLARAKQKKSKDFGSKTVSSWPVDMTHMILKDKAIPAVLTRSIDSRYPSVPASAIVERNVYAEDGRNIIIPAGSKLIGTCSGGAGTNHVAKLEISWERLIRPDGSQFQMSAVSGDAQGRGGVAAYLDEQWLAKYGKPLMASTLTSAVAYITATDESVTQNQDYGTTTQSDRAQAAQDARENFIDNMEQIFQQMIEESSSTPPVVFVPSGTRMTVFAMDDLWLRTEDDDVDDYEQEFGADPTSSFAPQNGGMQERPSGPVNTNANAAATSAPATLVDEEEEYYDPGYTGDEEEEIYTPASAQKEEVAPAPKQQQPNLEEAYRSRQGLGRKSNETGKSTPLQQKSTTSSSTKTGTLF